MSENEKKNEKSPPESAAQKGPGVGMAKRKWARTNLFVNGVEVPFCPLDIPADQHIRELKDLAVRDDDILVAAYPKCGTHWMWEVVQMLVNQTTTHEVRAKEYVMMEFVRASHLAEERSPRILNSHLFMAHLPPDFISKKTKILHVVRNPKDVMVSMYHHFKNRFELTWEGLINGMVDKTCPINNQFEFLRQLTEFQKQHPDHPVKLVYYEDMKKDPLRVTKEVADFLEVPATDSFCRQVVDACSFDQLKKADEKKDLPGHLGKKVKGQQSSLYRKGIIGDWKNQFTVAQNEMFEKFIQEESQGLPFTFTYQD